MSSPFDSRKTGLSNRRKVSIRFSIKLVLGIAVLSIVGLVTVSITVNTLVRGTIYDNVISIIQRDNIIYAEGIGSWFAVANQTVNSLAAALRALPSTGYFPAIAAGFTADFGFVENVFIGFADGSVINGIGWTPTDVGDELDGVGWGPWEHWVITDRPWFLAAKEAGAGRMIITEPYLSLSTGNITAAIATWIPELGGVGASVGFSISLDFIEERLAEHPVMGNGYLILFGSVGEILFHPNPEYAPCSYCPYGHMRNLRNLPNGQLLMDSLAAGIHFVEFDHCTLGPSYFIATHLETIDWTLVAIIPTEATQLLVYENLTAVMIAFTLVVIGLLVFTLFFIAYLKRNMEETRVVEEKLRGIIDNMPLVANISTRDSSIIECNEEAPRLFGLRDRQEYMERYFELQPPFQPDGSKSTEKALAMEALAFEKGQYRFEWVHQHINGEAIPCEVTLIRLSWRSEYQLLSFVRDLRESYAAQKKEREVMQRMQAMLDSSPLACAILDENFKVLEVNQELLRLFELNTKQKYIDSFFDFSPRYQPDGRHSSEKMVKKARLALESGKVHFEWMYQTLDEKTIPCEVTIVRITHNEANLLITYVRDLREINEAVHMVKQLEKLAFIDTLTGANNRRYFVSSAERELIACINEKRDLAIIMFDIDNFKAVNDTYGHDIGDEVLKIVVARTRHSLKQDTLVARYGGEEFVIMLSNITPDSAAKIAWQIQKKIADTPFSAKGVEINITVSFGVASKTENCTTLSGIMKNADRALYHAKNSGKNTVVSWEALDA